MPFYILQGTPCRGAPALPVGRTRSTASLSCYRPSAAGCFRSLRSLSDQCICVPAFPRSGIYCYYFPQFFSPYLVLEALERSRNASAPVDHLCR
jgi:hypothetical protein